VILCRFNDVPALHTPRAKFFDFVSEYGRGGLFDYWRDASYGAIDLAGSEVFGWYTMKYSFVHDSADPFKDGSQGRSAWISEAIRLADEAGVDLSRFYGVIAVINANADDSNAGRNTALAIGGAWGQTNWHWCQKCQGLAYGGGPSPGACPAGGLHNFSGSGDYALSANDATFPGQDNWRWCRKCQGLAFNGNPSPGSCPSGGLHDHSTSADYRLGIGKVGYPSQNDWRWCRKCQGLSYGGNPSLGPCPAGGTHDHTSSANYALVSIGSGLNTTFNAHETGHGYGLPHSWSANPDVEYGDPWDIMSAMRVRTFANGDYPPAGPELNAPTRYKLGWLSNDRVFTYSQITSRTGGILQLGQRIDLVALNRPELPGYLMARVLTPNHIYTVEFRQPTGWDRGIKGEGVLIHELRSSYTTGQNNWHWCDKCQGLTFSGTAICPAGGVHDHTGSGNYKLAISDPGFSGQHSWRWCRKCQGLAFAAGAPGPCPAGGDHDHSASADYGLAINNSGFPGQSLWKWCNKCQGLTYAGNAVTGACSAGGKHDHSGSGNYTLTHDNPSASGQDQWRWCRKCQGLAYDGYGVCAAGGFHNNTRSGDYSLEFNHPSFPGQDLWKWCNKCQGLAYAGNVKPGACPASGQHDHTGSGNYSLLYDVGSNNGQNQWRWCRKCQLLAYAGNPSPGSCPAGGVHDHSTSLDYTLANFGQDLSYLIQGDWQPGQEFHDVARDVRIAIEKFDSDAGTATIIFGSPVVLSPHQVMIDPHILTPGRPRNK
jgi:hypothetical protein